MLSLHSTISKEINNTTQKYDCLITKPQLRNMREITLGMILGKSCHLTKIGNKSSHEVTPRKNTERYSRALAGIDSEACTERHIFCSSLKFRNEPVLLLGDGGDFQKKHAYKMKGVCKNVDGSDNHSPGRGYPTFAIVAYGIETKRQLPLCHHLHSTKDEDFKSEWFEHKKCYEKCAPFLNSDYDRIAVEDRGGDDKKRFLFFVEQQMSFVTRINTGAKSRGLYPVKDDEIEGVVSVQELCEQMEKKAGAEKKWRNKKFKKDMISKIAFTEVRLPKHNDIPLYLVLLYTDCFEDPMAVLTDIEVNSFEDAWKIFFYYKKRWEVENFFRAIKQQFDAEKFLIRDFDAIKTLAFIQMMAFAFLCTLREKLLEVCGMLFAWFQEFCRRNQRKKQSHLDLLHWIREVWNQMPVTVSYRYTSMEIHRNCYRKPKNQLRLFSPLKKW